MRRPALAVGIAAALLLAAACGDDDDTAAPTTTTTTAAGDAEGTTTTASDADEATTTTTTEGEPERIYPDHVSEQYAGTTNWLCHPELADDECDDLATTVVAADGTQTVDELAPADDPPIDCLYIYPTVSQDPGVIADLDAGDEERSTTRAQFARYGTVCRTFAPIYRQFTLNAIGGAEATDEEAVIPYGDVLDAFETFVDDLSDGRPFVLIGHSQGSGHLNRILREEVASNPALRERLVSALLLGNNVAPIDGIPACESADETGCLVTYVSFPADAPPTEGSLFGRTRDTGEPALCVDPVALVGGDGLADAVAPTQATLIGANPELASFPTAYVDAPGAFRTECAENDGYRYLAVSIADPADPRPLGRFLEEILGPTWGLHLYDANLVQGDLLELVARQAEAFASGS